MTNTTTKTRRRMAREPHAETSASANVETEHSVESDSAPTEEKQPSKTDKVLSLLRRAGGATLDEMVEETGWLPHTTRAVMTGLKKKGHQIERTKADGVSGYSIVEAASQ